MSPIYMANKVTESCDKVSHKYVCNFCDYNTSKKSSYTKHLLTDKHKKVTQVTEANEIGDAKIAKSEYFCKNCNKKYNSRNGLWKHKNTCVQKNSDENNDELDEIYKCSQLPNFSPTDLTDKQLVVLLINENMKLIKENSDFKNLMLEQQNMMMEFFKNGTNNTTNNNNTNNHNNSHNKTFNLNFFLNEQCKDALNMSEFIDSIKVELCDVENTGRHGFIEGISKLLLKNLKALDKYKRPIHCSDLKRESLYIKDNDLWEKDDEDKMKLKNSIKQIASKNIKKIAEWVQQYPDCREPDSRKNDLYLHIVSNSMFGGNDEETEKNLNGVIKNIAKEVVIDKTC